MDLKVDAEHGVRLDTYLASQFEGWSRARLQRLIENEDVLVNSKPAKPSYKLRENDEIEVELIAPPADVFAPENIPIEIVYEDETLVVVNKPADWWSILRQARLQARSPTHSRITFNNFPARTCGLGSFIVSIETRQVCWSSRKTEAALENLSDQFRDRTVFKSYGVGAWARGFKLGKIDQPLARDPSNRRAWRSCVAVAMR